MKYDACYQLVMYTGMDDDISKVVSSSQTTGKDPETNTKTAYHIKLIYLTVC